MCEASCDYDIALLHCLWEDLQLLAVTNYFCGRHCRMQDCMTANARPAWWAINTRPGHHTASAAGCTLRCSIADGGVKGPSGSRQHEMLRAAVRRCAALCRAACPA